MSKSMSEISITNLIKTYGSERGVDDLSLEIHKGEIFGFLGPNGAGKTTTIRCMMNILIPNSGTIKINDTFVSRDTTELREKIGYLPGEINFPRGYTAKNFIDYITTLKKKPAIRKDEIIKRFKLDINKKIHALSHGNKQKLGIVLAFMHDPDVLILDEPTSGLDPLFQQELYNLLEEEKKKGKTIFFSSHNLDEVQKICDRVAIIREGKLISLEDVDKLADKVPRKLRVIVNNFDSNKLTNKEFQYEIDEKNQAINFTITNNDQLTEVLKILPEMDVVDISYPPASLEEYFLLQYNGG